MSNICLETKTKEQEILKKYLEDNASDVLTDKINNGVKIEKDCKTVINKKTLDTFMKYATEEAKKLAEKGANSAMVEDRVVFGWLIHYFEEADIIGILYNEDGTEYKKPITKAATPTTKYEPTKPVKKGPELISMFDNIDDLFSTNTEEEQEPEPEEPITNDAIKVCNELPVIVDVNTDTGEIIEETVFDSEIIAKLYGIFGDVLEGY